MTFLVRSIPEEWLEGFNRQVVRKKSKDTPIGLMQYLNRLLETKTLTQERMEGPNPDGKNSKSTRQYNMIEQTSRTNSARADSLASQDQMSYELVMTNNCEWDERADADLLFTAHEKKTQNYKCEYCKLGHSIYRCEVFFALNPGQRRAAVIDYGGCFVCLRSGHSFKECRHKNSVSCRYCKLTHHSWIHLIKPEDGKKQSKPPGKGGQVERPSPPTSKEDGLKQGDTASTANVQVSTGSRGQRGNLATYRADDSCAHNAVGQTEEERRGIGIQTITVHISNGDKEVTVNALTDGGANSHAMDTSLAEELGFRPSSMENHTVHVGGGKQNDYVSPRGDIEIVSFDRKYRRKLNVRVYPRPIGGYMPLDWKRLQSRWDHLKDLDIPPPVYHRGVQLLIGTKDFDAFAPLEGAKMGKDGEPCAYRCKLGWVCAGRSHPDETDGEGSVHVTFAAAGEENPFDRLARSFPNRESATVHSNVEPSTDENGEHTGEVAENAPEHPVRAPDATHNESESELTTDERLDRMIQRVEALKTEQEQMRLDMARLWNHETEEEEHRLRNSISPSRLTKDEQTAARRFDDTFRSLDPKGYEVGLIWKEERPSIQNNYYQALELFRRAERRYHRDPELKKQYDAIITDWLARGYLEEVPANPKDPGFYLTNFLVVRLDKKSTKYRLVINGASEFNGKSLNDFLLPGANRISDMYKILDTLRNGNYVLGLDIEAMFMKVRVRPED